MTNIGDKEVGATVLDGIDLTGFAVDDDTSLDACANAVRQLQHAAKTGDRARAALRALAKDGFCETKVPLLKGSVLSEARLHRRIPAVPEDVPDYSAARVSTGAVERVRRFGHPADRVEVRLSSPRIYQCRDSAPEYRPVADSGHMHFGNVLLTKNQVVLAGVWPGSKEIRPPRAGGAWDQDQVIVAARYFANQTVRLAVFGSGPQKGAKVGRHPKTAAMQKLAAEALMAFMPSLMDAAVSLAHAAVVMAS